jgi:hypothetical protein
MRICRSGSECNEERDVMTTMWLWRRVWGVIKPDLSKLISMS